MRQRITPSLLAAITLSVLTANVALGQLITEVTATASSSLTVDYTAAKAIDGTGLSGSDHGTANRAGWLSASTPIAGSTVDTSAQWIEFDLGSSQTLYAIQVWNYNQAGYADAGINQVDIYYSASTTPGDPEGGGEANWILLAEDVTFSKAPALATYTGFDLAAEIGVALPTTGVRYIRFEVDSHFGGNGSFPQAVGLSEIQFFNGPVVDTTAPTIESTSPEDGADEISINADLVATFDENIALLDGATITIRNLGPGLAPDEVITLPDTRVSVSGVNLTINPTSDLASGNDYAVRISNDAVEDLATSPNAFTGILVDTTWNFSTAVAGSRIVSVAPADGAYTAAPGTNLTITFNGPISIGTGNITIKNLSNGSGSDIVIDVADAGPVSVSGQVLTINPSADLVPNKRYAVQIDSGVVTDSGGVPFAGILAPDITTWNFATIPTGSDYKVLIIGDSISIGYTNPVRSYLNGIATVSRIPDNARYTDYGLENLETWLGTESWDVIHFNWGLWDLARRNGPNVTTTLEQYEANLNLLVTQLKATGARLVWAHTTYVPENESIRQFGDDLLYNAVAARVMAQQGIPVNDLNTLSRSFPVESFLAPNDVHYTATGYSLLGQQVADLIVAGLIDDFTNWIDGFGLDPADKGFDSDPDGDNLANGLEAWFGTHPGQRTTGLANISTTGLTTTFTHPHSTTPPGDLTGYYEWSPNLSDWYPSGTGPTGGPIVTFTTSTTGLTTTVTATASVSEGTDRIFLRAGVSQD